MKEVIVYPNLAETKIVDSPIPKPEAHQVLIKVIVAGSNPKDWKYPIWNNVTANTGDDIAGVVEDVGEGVFEFKKGDRVGAFHQGLAPHGSFAEYAIAWDYATFNIPEKLSYEETATVPLAALTAALVLYSTLRLPHPWTPATKPLPLIVYGAATAVGAFTIKLAKLSNIHPIIGIVGRGKDFAETLIDRSKGDTLIDYRNGDEAVVASLQAELKKLGYENVEYAVDAVSEKGTVVNLSQVVDPEKGHIATVLFTEEDQKKDRYRKGVKATMGRVGLALRGIWPEGSEEEKLDLTVGGKEFSYLFLRFFARGLDQGWFSPHPYKVVEKGLEGVGPALQDLKDGKASAVKYVFRIADTPGL